MEDKTPPQDSPSGAAAHGADDCDAGVMKRAVSEFVSARLELAAIEAKEAAAFTVRKVVWAVALALCAFFVWMLLLAGLAGLLADWAETRISDSLPGVPGWVAVLFGLAVLHALAAVVLVVLLKKKPAAPLFELTRQEIENDRTWVKNNK